MSTETVQPPGAAAEVLAALTMTPDAGRLFWKALIYASGRISREARVEGAEASHAEWLEWGASRLDAAIRAADVPSEPVAATKLRCGHQYNPQGTWYQCELQTGHEGAHSREDITWTNPSAPKPAVPAVTADGSDQEAEKEI